MRISDWSSDVCSSDLRVRRFTSFLDPWADQLGSGYQLSNALMAVGRGEWFGVGLGASVQKLSYLPEAHTDFIFSVLAEELGFVGVCLRSEEHTSALQSLMRITSPVFFLEKKTTSY